MRINYKGVFCQHSQIHFICYSLSKAALNYILHITRDGLKWCYQLWFLYYMGFFYWPILYSDEGSLYVLCITNDKSIFCDGQILQDSHSEWLIWDDALSMKVTKVLCMKNSSETPFSSSNRIFYCNNNDILMTL